MAHQFRLATLLRLRERERDVAAKALQDVRLAIDKLDDALREINDTHRSMDQIRKDASQGAIAIQQVLEAQRFQMVLSAQESQIKQNLGLLHQERERRESALLKCQQSVKSLEKLKTQRIAAADTLAMSKQQERLDEWSSIRHAMSVNATNSTIDES